MNSYFRRVVLILHSALVLLMLSGCSTSPVSKGSPGATSNMDQKLVTLRNIPREGPKLASLSPETNWVIGAIVTSMRGKSLSKDTNKHIELADGLAKSIREKYFRYEGFTLTSTAISEYHYLEADSNFRWLSVFLRFYDDYGRSVTTVVRAEYRLVEGKIIVESAIIMPLSSHNPRVKLYYVPVDKLSDQRFTKNSSYKEILWFVQEKAVAINIPEQVPHKRQNYWIFAFVTDRLAKDAKIELRVSKSQKGLKGDNTKAKTLNFDNWFITRARGEFAFGQVDRVFYKVVYSSDSDVSVEKQKLQIIGVFSTQ